MITVWLYVFMVIVLIAVSVWQHKHQKRQHKERMELMQKQINAANQLAEDLKGFAVSADQVASMKRWMSETIRIVQEHSEKVDELLAAQKTHVVMNTTIQAHDDLDAAQFLAALEKAAAVTIHDDRSPFEKIIDREGTK